VRSRGFGGPTTNSTSEGGRGAKGQETEHEASRRTVGGCNHNLTGELQKVPSSGFKMAYGRVNRNATWIFAGRALAGKNFNTGGRETVGLEGELFSGGGQGLESDDRDREKKKITRGKSGN